MNMHSFPGAPQPLDRYRTEVSGQIDPDFDVSDLDVQRFGVQVCIAMHSHPKIKSKAGFCFFTEFQSWVERQGREASFPIRAENHTVFAQRVWQFVEERNLWKHVAFNHFHPDHPDLKVLVPLRVAASASLRILRRSAFVPRLHPFGIGHHV